MKCPICGTYFPDVDQESTRGMEHIIKCQDQHIRKLRGKLDRARSILAGALADLEADETGRCRARLRMYAIDPEATEEPGEGK